ncbi:MAG: AmmeMemoRadiSam system radical SAM enzyme [Treponema sp.]|jgi:pyruvate formate lyase activating enzyme|nr:AmmeMemoRadiSam system radical SAM enzyme [Treponema sp.]
MEMPADCALEQAVPRFFSEEGGLVRCGLCPRRCAIPSGDFGVCGVRGNKNGRGIIPFYGFTSALAVDPIEKKPLYHFRPGSAILSLGLAGCNLRCPFCQNWHISQNTGISGRRMRPGELVSAALRGNGASIAYTYSEPLVHAEYLLDCMALAHKHGVANVLVTNGCVNAEAAREILSLTDAANIDLKCFSPETYAETLGGDLRTVLDFIRLALEQGVHVELTTLVVPGLNDSAGELARAADFIAGLSGAPEVPWHLSAYHPDYRWNAPPTDPAFLLRAAELARGKLRYVYTGNIAGGKNDTLCPHCGAVLVRRRDYRVDARGLAPSAAGERACRCAACGGKTPLV